MRGIAFLLLVMIGNVPLSAKELLIDADTIRNEPRGRYFVVSIGINQYRDEFWPDLRWAAADASNSLSVIGKDTQYERVPMALVDHAATLANVRTVLEDVARKVAPRDIVVLYLSGHGTLTPSADGDLARIAVMHDTQKNDLANTGLSHGELRRWMDRLRANKKMMILATCNSGLGKSRLTEEVTQYLRSHKGALVPLADVSEGALILSAAAKDEAAREDDSLGGDVYTHFFLAAAHVSDRNRDGQISAMEAHDYAKEQTWVYTNGKQRPSAEAKFIGDADIPLVGRKKNRGLPLLDAYSEQWSGFRVAVNGREKGTIPTAVALEADVNEVAVFSPTDAAPLAKYRVLTVGGDAISIEDVMYRRPFNITMRLQNYRWEDHAWAALTGAGTTSKFELDLGVAGRTWAAGLALNLPEENAARVRTNLEAASVWTAHTLYVEYGRRYNRWNAALRASAGLERIELELHDAVGGDDLQFVDRAWAYGLGFTGGYEFFPDLRAIFSYSVFDADWQFEKIGSLDGKRSAIGLGIQYRFDPRIRSVHRGDGNAL